MPNRVMNVWEMKNGVVVHKHKTYRYSIFHYLGEPTEWFVSLIDAMTGEKLKIIKLRSFMNHPQDYQVIS